MTTPTFPVGNLTVSGTATVTGASTLGGPVGVGGTLTVLSAALLESTLTVQGTTSLAAVSASGAVTGTGFTNLLTPYAVNTAPVLTGPLSLTGAGGSPTATITETVNGNGVVIKLLGNGGATPAKYLQVALGSLFLLNNALLEIAALTDSGILTFPQGGAGVGTVVGSVAALRGLLKTGNPTCFVTGYYAAGDGGGGQYWYNSADTSSADNGGTIIVASDGGRWYLDFVDFVTTKQFGCHADGVTDDTTSLQKAMTAVANLKLSIGKHLISSVITIVKSNFTLTGNGQDSQILTNSATANILAFGDGTNEYQNILLRDFSIDSTVSKSAGSAIILSKCTRTHITNVFASPPETATNPPRLFWGIYCNQFDYTVIESCTIIVNGNGIVAAGNSSGTYGAGFYITGGTKVNTDNVAGSVGVLIGGGCGGVVFGECDIIGCEQNVRFDNTIASAPNREQFFTAGCTLDSAGDNNIWVRANGASVIDMTGTWCSSAGQTNSGGVGILVDSSQAGSNLYLKCSGVRMFNNAGGGAVINAGGFFFNGGFIENNGGGGSGGHGINFATANVFEKTITGTTIINNGFGGTGYGINIVAGVTNTNIQCNTIRNNTTGQINDGSGAVNKLIANNLLT
jgi:hypothetical protein